MALTSRISLQGSEPTGPEDYLSTSLGVIFPDDVTNQHGDAEHSLVYTSPRLPRPLSLELADPAGESERRLFSHYLWNASLLLAEMVEADTLAGSGGGGGGGRGGGGGEGEGEGGGSFDVRGRRVVELGAGTALPSIMAGLLGAERVLATDYPAPGVLAALTRNLARNVRAENAPPGREVTPSSRVVARGHAWGDLSAFCGGKKEEEEEDTRHAFDRVLAADCLWMPWQHDNLRRSIDHFLGRDADARAWIVAGFHTGRAKMRDFFDPAALLACGLVVHRMWEVDCDGCTRDWLWDRDEEDISVRKRWLVVAELRRGGEEEGKEEGTAAAETAGTGTA